MDKYRVDHTPTRRVQAYTIMGHLIICRVYQQSWTTPNWSKDEYFTKPEALYTLEPFRRIE